MTILTSAGERLIRIRRVHLEEDTGKLTHISNDEETYSLVDLNRSGVPLLEIVSEPDLHSSEEVRVYATVLRWILRYLGVNSGDMQKGVMRIEPNISVRPVGAKEMGTRVEIKNLNSFRALERSVAYEIKRQSEQLSRGHAVIQETVGWDESLGVTFSQRVKETEDDYRYFPEPDLPPLVVDSEWVAQIQAGLPELPIEKARRFHEQYGLNEYDAGVLVAEKAVADYFEATVKAATAGTDDEISPKMVSNWLTGEFFGLLNQRNMSIEQAQVSPEGLAGLIQMVCKGDINQNTAKTVLHEMFDTGKSADDIVSERGLLQISDSSHIAKLVNQVLAENPDQVKEYLDGKDAIQTWLFGQVMRAAKAQANPQVVKAELERQLNEMRAG
jgi:aspartyl-tRNA(Asn)/glutamyl-tRNA(Gln) amidotransferase subunit B